MTLLILLTPLLRVALGLTIALTLIERLVAQLLLLAHQLVEFAHLTVHFARRLILRATSLRRLQILQKILELVEHALCVGHVAGFRHVLEPIQHVLEVLRGNHPVGVELVVVGLLLIAVLVAAHLVGEFTQELVEGGAKLFGEFLDLFVGRATLERFAQLLLKRPEIALGVGEIAVLEPQRHFPHQIRNADQRVVGLRLRKAERDRVEPEVNVGGRAEPLRRYHQRVHGRCNPRLEIRRENEIPALLDQRAREWFDENPLRERHFDRFAATDVAAFVAGGERQVHARARPRVLRKIGCCLSVAESRARWQRKPHTGRLDQRTAGHRLAVDDWVGEFGFGCDHAVVVLDLVAQGQ